MLLFACATLQAQVTDTDALRQMGQSDKDAGRISTFRVVEPYRAMAAVLFRSHARTNRESEAAARSWAADFCTRASNGFQWERRWRLTAYVNNASGPIFTCFIPSEEASIGDERRTPEDPDAWESTADSPGDAMREFD